MSTCVLGTHSAVLFRILSPPKMEFVCAWTYLLVCVHVCLSVSTSSVYTQAVETLLHTEKIASA